MLVDGVFWSSRSHHKPPHLYLPGAPHMVTGSTLDHAPLLRDEWRKAKWLEVLTNLCCELGVQVIAWVVLDDHYHAVVVPADAAGLGRLLARLHSVTATAFNRADRAPGRQVWYSHWDRVLHTEGDLYSRINYVHRNPVKHGYVDDPAEWPWSSFRSFLEVDDPEVLSRLERFPAPLRLPGD